MSVKCCLLRFVEKDDGKSSFQRVQETPLSGFDFVAACDKVMNLDRFDLVSWRHAFSMSLTDKKSRSRQDQLASPFLLVFPL